VSELRLGRMQDRLSLAEVHDRLPGSCSAILYCEDLRSSDKAQVKWMLMLAAQVTPTTVLPLFRGLADAIMLASTVLAIVMADRWGRVDLYELFASWEKVYGFNEGRIFLRRALFPDGGYLNVLVIGYGY